MYLCMYYMHACFSSSSTGSLESVASFVMATTVVTFLTCGYCRLHHHHLIDREETVHNLMRLSMGVASMWLLSNCMLTCIHPGILIPSPPPPVCGPTSCNLGVHCSHCASLAVTTVKGSDQL